MKKNIILGFITLAFICAFSSCHLENADHNFTHRGYMMYKTWEEKFNYFESRIELAFNFNAWVNATGTEKEEIQQLYFNRYTIKNTGTNQWMLINIDNSPAFLIRTEGTAFCHITEYPHNVNKCDSIRYSLTLAPDPAEFNLEGADVPLLNLMVQAYYQNTEIEKCNIFFTLPNLPSMQHLPGTIFSEPLNFLKGSGVFKVDAGYQANPENSISADHLEFNITKALHSLGMDKYPQFDSGELELRAYNQHRSKTANIIFNKNIVTVNYNNHSEDYDEYRGAGCFYID